MERINRWRAFGGWQEVWRHDSKTTGTPMEFSIFLPEGEGPKPVLWYLSGLTCNWSNVTEKGDYREACARHGIVFVAPDTSPRGEGVADDAEGAYDFGLGAGFYVDATEEPFAKHYKMRQYIEEELPALIAEHFPVDLNRQAITGHSMGGHGALTIGLRNPERFKSVSAFAPISAPTECPWGHKALGGYLGEDRAAWAEYDACKLIEGGARVAALKVDQGGADGFLEEQLKPELLRETCDTAGQVVELEIHDGYDHSYYFISSFMPAHIDWHAKYLKA
ncbi:S-formylglutathione hydrolase [Pararhodobacter oceanensis]|uniref:S-formylglutathione hydrolase n=1 Tax=Pararhodobacter oceanensis TaxID=2172121 RepID=A0A2T8HSF4_9RHOB|nr:S-formylglutathione hydrolase [Pararhodobacter oceanensis]PVH28313.1 S-formylglutathione hydrolase [Pararhodobacter oceanensis]